MGWSLRIALVVALVGLSRPAGAVILLIDLGLDRGFCHPGDLLTIRVTGLAQAAVDDRVFGVLSFTNPSIGAPNLDAATPVQNTLLTPAPVTGWTEGATSCDASSCVMFNQTIATPATAANQLVATVAFVVTTLGTSNIQWVTTGPSALEFFGITSLGTGIITVTPPGTLTVTLDKPDGVYDQGDPITITVTGDSLGGGTRNVHGRLVFSNPAVVSPGLGGAVPVQNTLIAPPGSPAWTPGALSCVSAGSCRMFLQDTFSVASQATNTLTSTLSLVAGAAGTTQVTWNTTTGADGLRFFGATNQPGVTITVVAPTVPISAPAQLMIAALLGMTVLAALLRRRARSH